MQKQTPAKWLLDHYRKWEDLSGRKQPVSAFARWLGVKQPTLNATRPMARLNEPLFAAKQSGRPMDRNNLGNMLESAADRAGLRGINPHRFRHTFAINYLRNGGDIYTLQAILGHERLEMCLRYLRIAQADLENAHRKASPVENWNL